MNYVYKNLYQLLKLYDDRKINEIDEFILFMLFFCFIFLLCFYVIEEMEVIIIFLFAVKLVYKMKDLFSYCLYDLNSC